MTDHNVADTMAKLGSLLPDVNKKYICPSVEECIDFLISYANSKWKQTLKTCKTGKTYHELFPLDSDKPPVAPSRKMETVIFRMRLHSCFLNQYLFKIGLHPDGLCSVCNVLESVEHFLLNCAKHQKLTKSLSDAAINQGLIPSLRLYLSKEPFLTLIYQYVVTSKIKI